MARTFLLGIGTVVLLAGCSHASATPVNGPDGSPGWFSVSCKKDQSNCDEKAGDVCPDGYDVANQSGESGTRVAVSVTPYGGYGSASPTFHGHMLIKCHGAPNMDAAD